MVAKLKTLSSQDDYRVAKTEQLAHKLFEMGVINARQGLAACEKINVSAFARRRLPVLMQKMKMAETIKDAVMYIEQGHVKVGVDTVTDPAFHVTRSMEDHITWVRTSKIAAKVKNYRQERDDFEIFE